MSADDPILQVEGVTKRFPPAGRKLDGGEAVNALNGVSIQIRQGETLGVVGESGCGKSTLARCVAGLHTPTTGVVSVDGVDINGPRVPAQAARKQVQMVFQDPASSLNPRLSVYRSVAEPLGRRSRDCREEVADALARVGLGREVMQQRPRQLSGGQQQRVCIARSLIGGARLIVHDEAVSALDVSLQAQVLALLNDLQAELQIAYLFISHDLAVVQAVSHRIAVMYLGKVVELAPVEKFHREALHPYTVVLRSAVPYPDPVLERRRRRILVEGDIPSNRVLPPGCSFASRCPIARPKCAEESPPLTEHRPGHWAACHFPGELSSTETSTVRDAP